MATRQATPPKRNQDSVGDAFVTVRMPREMHERLAELSRSQDRTLSAEIRRAVAAHLELQQAPEPSTA